MTDLERRIIPRESLTSFPQESVQGEALISDERVRQILSRFGFKLHQAIRHSKDLTGNSHGIDGTTLRPMFGDELTLWDRHFNIQRKVEDGIASDSLQVASIIADEDSQATVDQSDTVETNLPEFQHRLRVASDPLETSSVQYYLTPFAYFQGRYMGDVMGVPLAMGGKGLQRAFVTMEVLAQDDKGRWLISRIPGTDPSSKLYGIHSVVSTGMRFNTSIEKRKPNLLEVDTGTPTDLMITCRLNNLGEINELDIPSDPNLRLFFWQLNRFMKKDLIDQTQIEPLSLSSGQ